MVPNSRPVGIGVPHEALQKEINIARPHFKGTEEDLIMACKCVVAVRRSISLLNITSEFTKFDYTNTPGLIRITVIGLAKVDAKPFVALKRLRLDFDAEVVFILSPREEQCITIGSCRRGISCNPRCPLPPRRCLSRPRAALATLRLSSPSRRDLPSLALSITPALCITLVNLPLMTLRAEYCRGSHRRALGSPYRRRRWGGSM